MASKGESLICLLALPTEILSKIAFSDSLDYVDVCKLSQVCRRLNEVCNNNAIWKRKFYQCWPLTAKSDLSEPQTGWLEMIKFRLGVTKEVNRHLTVLADSGDSRFRDMSSSASMATFLVTGNQHVNGQHMIVEDLVNVLIKDRWKNLTQKYYARKVLRLIHQKLLSLKLAAFLERPEDEQYLEEGAFLFSCWMQPEETVNLSLTSISSKLNDIADKVRKLLSETSSSSGVHPACTKDNSISGFTESLWSGEQCRRVLEAINHVFYEQLQFAGNQDDYYNPDNSFIEKVLEMKTGIPITMSIVYGAVARRLGVICHPVNTPGHFLLMFKDSSAFRNPSDQITLIDAFNQGRLMTPQECDQMVFARIHAHIDIDFAAAVTRPTDVLLRMARNLQRHVGVPSNDQPTLLLDSSSFYLSLAEYDADVMSMYIQLCVHFNITEHEVMELLPNLPPEELERFKWDLRMNRYSMPSSKEEKKVKKRSENPEVAFSVGMVMKHRRYGYFCVIYGWDHKCLASKEWMARMGVHGNMQHQPFYNVLGHDRSTRYAAQENLMYTTEVTEIDHPEVGKYFEEFKGHYYVMNSFRQKEYPDDIANTKQLADEYFRLHSEGLGEIFGI